MVLSQQRKNERGGTCWQHIQSGEDDGTEKDKEYRWDEESWKNNGQQEGLLVAVSMGVLGST